MYGKAGLYLHYYKDELSVSPIAIAGKIFEPGTCLVTGWRANNLGYATPIETYPWLIPYGIMDSLGLLYRTFYFLSYIFPTKCNPNHHTPYLGKPG
jgi:hypothetical protein